MKPSSQSDEWLMGQVAAGKRECLEILVRRYATPLLTYLQRMTGDPHQSEELVQEVFLAVWTKRKQYKLTHPLRSWIYAIATNRCREAFRKGKIRRTEVLDESAAATPASRSPTPSQVALGSERATLVSSAVAQLPEQQRMVVTLKMWGGLSYAEIAETAGRTEGTVRSHMSHALDTLRKVLAPQLADEA